MVQMNLEKELRKEIQKKRKGGQALLGRPASLSAQPSSAARPPLDSLPRADARLAPPDAGHVAAVRRRRGRPAGRPAYPDRDGTPRPQAPFCLPRSTLSSSSLARAAAAAATAAVPLPAEAPPLAACRASGPFSAPRPPLCSPSPR